MLAADTLFWPALAGIVLFNILFAPRIRASRVAMQWSLDGTPTWHAPKWLALVWPVLLLLLVRLIIWAAMTYTPSLVHGPDVGLALATIIIAAAHVFVLMRAAKAG